MLKKFWLARAYLVRVSNMACVLFGFLSCELLASDEAALVYSAYKKSIFQIRIVEIESDSQSSLGTGFVIGNGLVATNYHVISSKIFEPEKYRIETDDSGREIVFEVLTFDVTNDIALLIPQSQSPDLQLIEEADSLLVSDAGTEALIDSEMAADRTVGSKLVADESGITEPLDASSITWDAKPFEIESIIPQKGETLFSLGNPHNIGMTVVEGIFNGMVEHRFLDQIHFSGAINPGMSGGPVLNNLGKVVGINVATAGNQIGFLVPAKALAELLKTVNFSGDVELIPPSSDELMQLLGQQVGDYTTRMIEASLADPWEAATMGRGTILSSPLPWLDCWGDSQKNKKAGHYTISRGCHSGSNIFLSHRLNTGYLEYEYMYFEAEKWPSISVYDYLVRDTSSASPANFGSNKELGEFDCVDVQVENSHNLKARISYCTRAYKKFPAIFDVFFMAISVDKKNQALMSHYTLAGVRKDAAEIFLTHFLEVISWTQE